MYHDHRFPGFSPRFFHFVVLHHIVLQLAYSSAFSFTWYIPPQSPLLGISHRIIFTCHPTACPPAVPSQKKCRIVGLSASLANAKDVGDWIGATAHSLVSFRPDVRPVPLELRLHGFDVNHFGSRMLAMAKPAYTYVAAGTTGKNYFL